MNIWIFKYCVKFHCISLFCHLILFWGISINFIFYNKCVASDFDMSLYSYACHILIFHSHNYEHPGSLCKHTCLFLLHITVLPLTSLKTIIMCILSSWSLFHSFWLCVGCSLAGSSLSYAIHCLITLPVAFSFPGDISSLDWYGFNMGSQSAVWDFPLWLHLLLRRTCTWGNHPIPQAQALLFSDGF